MHEKKYIDAEVAKRVVMEQFRFLSPYEVLEIICALPAADVEPVRRGKWVIKSNPFCNYRACSECGEQAQNDNPEVILPNYCPHCGAKMDEKGEP